MMPNANNTKSLRYSTYKYVDNAMMHQYSINNTCDSRDQHIISPASISSSSETLSAWSLLEQGRSQETKKRPYLVPHPNWRLGIGVNQLAASAGAGKTQLSLSVCVSCVLKGGKAVIVLLGGSNRIGNVARRLQGMFKARVPSLSPFKTKEYLSQIWLHWVPNPDRVTELLYEKLPRLLQRETDIQVVVMDSIASLFRFQEEQQIPYGIQQNNSNWWLERASIFFDVSIRCRYLSDVHKTPFLILNEVTTKISALGGSFSKLEPALGLSWSQCCNASYMILHRSDGCRQLVCQRSPDHPYQTIDFKITQSGAILALDNT